MARKSTKIVEEKPAEEVSAVNTASAEEKKPAKKYKAKALSPHTMVVVRNGFHGKLVYKSSRDDDPIVWSEFGAEQDMELQELRDARNKHKKFFEDNYFLIDDPEIIEYLGVERFYKDALTYDNFDMIFDMTPDEIADKLSKLSVGQKHSVVYRAKQLINDGSIDSIKVITALEHGLGVELIEH